MKEGFADNLRRLRLEKGQTQQQLAKLIQRVGRDVLAVLHGVVVRQRKSHFTQTVGCDAPVFHRLEKWLVTDHLQPTPFCSKYRKYIRFLVSAIIHMYGY